MLKSWDGEEGVWQGRVRLYLNRLRAAVEYFYWKLITVNELYLTINTQGILHLQVKKYNGFVLASAYNVFECVLLTSYHPLTGTDNMYNNCG